MFSYGPSQCAIAELQGVHFWQICTTDEGVGVSSVLLAWICTALGLSIGPILLLSTTVMPDGDGNEDARVTPTFCTLTPSLPAKKRCSQAPKLRSRGDLLGRL